MCLCLLVHQLVFLSSIKTYSSLLFIKINSTFTIPHNRILRIFYSHLLRLFTILDFYELLQKCNFLLVFTFSLECISFLFGVLMISDMICNLFILIHLGLPTYFARFIAHYCLLYSSCPTPRLLLISIQIYCHLCQSISLNNFECFEFLDIQKMSLFCHHMNNFSGSRSFIQRCFLSQKFINIIQSASSVADKKSQSNIPFSLYLNLFICLKKM